jgi:hypothetical protein
MIKGNCMSSLHTYTSCITHHIYDLFNRGKPMCLISLITLMMLLNFTMISHATVARFASIESLTQQADYIVKAKVLRQWSEVSKNTPTTIYTYTNVLVEQAWKGDVDKIIQIRQLGGQVDELRLHVEGNAHFKLNQEVILFLKYDIHTNLYFILSLAQGVFYLQSPNVVEQDVLVFQDLQGITLYHHLVQHQSKLNLRLQASHQSYNQSYNHTTQAQHRIKTLADLHAYVMSTQKNLLHKTRLKAPISNKKRAHYNSKSSTPGIHIRKAPRRSLYKIPAQRKSYSPSIRK